MPKISVIIPVYNDEKYIAETLDSVIAQTFTDWEAICVNDGSTDNSLKILKQYAKSDKRIHIIDQKNQGVVIARNNAISKSKSDLIYPLDGDDIIKPDCLEKLYNKITNSNYRVVMSNVRTFGKINGFFKQPKLNKLQMYGWHECCIISALFYKSDFLKFGGYCEDFNGYGGDDMDYWLNYIDNNLPMIRLNDILFLYRIKEDKESLWKNYPFQERIRRHEYKEQKLMEKHPKMKKWVRLYKFINGKICRFFFRIQDGYIKIFKIPVINLNRGA